MLDLSNFKNNNYIKDLNYMFCGCENLIKIDLGNFKNEKEINLEHIFDGCKNLSNIDMAKFDFNKVKNIEGIFRGVPDEGSIVCNKSFKDKLVGVLPGGWEKVI